MTKQADTLGGGGGRKMNGKKVLAQIGCLLSDYVNAKPNATPKKTLAQQRELIKRKNTRAALLRQRQQIHDVYRIDREDLERFQEQLAPLNLHLQEIPGDGNCLFRALARTLNDGTNHEEQRKHVVEFMLRNRDDFEPFVENEMPFEEYLAVLALNGTYGGNDSIVAFARLHQVNVSVHQLGLPRWDVVPDSVVRRRTLHIAYHNGEHYSAILDNGRDMELVEEKWHFVLSTDKASFRPDESQSITSGDTFGSENNADQSTFSVVSAPAFCRKSMSATNDNKHRNDKHNREAEASAVMSQIELSTASFQGLRI